VDRAQRAQARLIVEQMQVGTEGACHERDPLLDRRPFEVAEPQVESLRDTGELSAVAADREHPGRGVDADHAHAGRRGRHRDPAGADAEFHHRRPGP
jgi:hypothetical protein